MTQLKSTATLEVNTTGQEDDYTTGCLLDCSYFKNNYQ